MSARKFLVALLVCMALTPASAVVPPEVPHQRSWEAFAPFFFAFTDNGESVFTGGGPACQGYSNANYFHQDSPPVSGVPATTGLRQFIQALQKPSGLLLVDSHGDPQGPIAVEAFSADDVQGLADARAALAKDTDPASGLGVTANDLLIERVVDVPRYWVLGVQTSFVQRILAEHAITYGTNCFGTSSASAFVNSSGKVRDYLAFSADVYTGQLFFPNDGSAVAQTVFNNMGGIQKDGGFFANIPMSAAVPLAQSLVSGLSPTYDSSRSPDPRNMRLYNAPRIVIADVTQDTAGDSSFSYSLYHYQFATTYPYNPSDTTDYPGAAGTSTFAKTGPLKIQLRFSEPMDPFWSSFQVQLRFADGTTQDITSGGSWDAVQLPNDSWSTTTTLPAGHDGKVVVAVRARKLLCGGQDVNNQELDTSGSGSSTAGTYDTSVNSAIERRPLIPGRMLSVRTASKSRSRASAIASSALEEPRASHPRALSSARTRANWAASSSTTRIRAAITV